MRLIWSPLAQDRLIEAASYIARHDPQAAEKWTDQLLERIERLDH
jgi:plasmid stabilization system protein ParE